jgi:hypothetical protein
MLTFHTWFFETCGVPLNPSTRCLIYPRPRHPTGSLSSVVWRRLFFVFNIINSNNICVCKPVHSQLFFHVMHCGLPLGWALLHSPLGPLPARHRPCALVALREYSLARPYVKRRSCILRYCAFHCLCFRPLQPPPTHHSGRSYCWVSPGIATTVGRNP